MTKNQWEVEVVTDAEDFVKWIWDEDSHSETLRAFVNEVSIEAAKVVNADLVKDAMLDLRPGEQDATFHAMFFGGNLEFSMPLGALVADFIESRQNHEAKEIDWDEGRQEAERLATQLEQAAARIRAALA